MGEPGIKPFKTERFVYSCPQTGTELHLTIAWGDGLPGPGCALRNGTALEKGPGREDGDAERRSDGRLTLFCAGSKMVLKYSRKGGHVAILFF